jgi:hypothetical protein
MSYVDLARTGPIVFEAPPKLARHLLDFWQRPIPVDGGKFFGDVGFFGPDEGKVGKFLLLPPGYKGPCRHGPLRLPLGTNNVFVFLRSFYRTRRTSPRRRARRSSKIYPLNGQAAARPMKFPDASGVPANMLPMSDASAFDQLKSLIDSEPSDLADPDWLGMLAGHRHREGTAVCSRMLIRRRDPRSRREDRLQDEPRDRHRGNDWRSLLPCVPTIGAGSNPIADGNTRQPGRAIRPGLEENQGRLSRPGHSDLFLH